MSKLRGLSSILLLALCCASGAVRGANARLDPAKPDDAVKLQQKIWCSLEDGKPVYLWSQGSVYGRRPGEADRKLLNFQIWNARACRGFSDPQQLPANLRDRANRNLATLSR